jgi:hypothetical protein
MPIQFSSAFLEFRLDDDAPADDAGPLIYAAERYADPERPDVLPMTIFLAHPDFQPFKQEFIDRIHSLRQFAENNQRRPDDPHAPGIRAVDIQPIRRDLQSYERNLFDPDYYPDLKGMLYGAAKKAFFTASDLIMQED